MLDHHQCHSSISETVWPAVPSSPRLLADRRKSPRARFARAVRDCCSGVRCRRCAFELLARQELVLRQEHVPGDKDFVDYTGQTAPIMDWLTSAVH